ncbi:Cytochrome c class I [Candidatus Methylacidithermus pantelleriae]|uniref:Cytochrome c class I n=2 Tax=Candidatus Methylacidithermus pantelleriae TaxID=2744239 RepID=A0A8J2BNG0_9BACT|nr:Cytochrome c class I [Candidatus Methylacidithermus pantelleriae]
MMAKITRVEVYVDGASEPFQVLTEEPFKVRLDPADFAEGDHFLRIAVHYDNGEYYDHLYTFTVAHRNEAYAGHLNRVPMGAPIDVDLIDPMEREATSSSPNRVLYALLPVVLFLFIGGVAAWFNFFGSRAASDVMTQIEPIPTPSQGRTPAAGPVDGAALYAQHCSVCHGPSGKGQPGVFPALAGNPNLADTDLVLNTILHGRPGTAMPPWGPRLSDEEIAAIVNYIRSSWGNDFGTVTREDVAAKR